jgi:monoamine oxidase
MLEETDVVVVGAGLAGLAAAEALHDEGRHVVVLEARDRVGGRTLNHDLGDGKVVEVGGQWVGPSQHRVLDLATRLGISTHPTYDLGRNILCLGERRVAYRGTVPWINPFGLLDVARVMGALERKARRVPLEQPWATPGARRLDAQTLGEWARRNVYSQMGRLTVELFSESVLACEPSEVSLLHFLFYVRSAGGFRNLTDVRGGAQQDRFVGGSQLISQRLAERLGPGTVQLSTPVGRIEHHHDRVLVHTRGGRVLARHAIVAMPPALAGRIAYDPPLPGQRDQLTQNAPMGSVIKCLGVYDEPFWRNEGYSGQAAGDGSAVRATFDNCTPEGNPGILLGFLEGKEARRMARLPASERRREVVNCFVRFFGPEAAHPVDFIEKDWTQEQWTRGCYGAHFGPGVWSHYGPALRQPVGRLHWAGTETATNWCGYMDGAVQSGQRAALEILEQLPAPVAAAATSSEPRSDALS